MDHDKSVRGVHQKTWEIFVIGVGLNDLIGTKRLYNHLPRNLPSSQPHIDMVGPQDVLLLNTLTYEIERIIWDDAFYGHPSSSAYQVSSTYPWGPHLKSGLRSKPFK